MVRISIPPPAAAEKSKQFLINMYNQAKQWLFTINNPTPEDKIDPGICHYLIVGHEIGTEGTPHLQGYAIFNKRQSFNQLKKLNPRAHWTQARGTPWQNKVYCSKDGDFEEWGHVPKPPGPSHKKGAHDEVFAEALQSDTVEEALAVIKEKRPRDFCLHGESIERNLKRAKKQSHQNVYALEDFEAKPLPLVKSTLICGPTNTGKTHFACAHFKNPLVVSHMDKLKSLSPENDGIVFDDMRFTHYPPEAVIHLLDMDFERDIHVRYGTVTIPAHTKKIFTHNSSNPFYMPGLDPEQADAIERRLERFQIYNKLFA